MNNVQVTQIRTARPPLYTWLPLVIAVAVLFDRVWDLLFRCQHDALGHFIYPLDDSYIQMAIARNFAQHGVWGVTRHAFGPASSSPLWTILLAIGFKLGGVKELLPLIMSAVAGVLVLIAVDWIARRERLAVWANAVLLLLVAVGAPLTMLAVTGMEHNLQILLDVLFVYGVATIACEEGRAKKSHIVALLILAALVCAVRYEGLFLIAAAALALGLRRRAGMAALIVGAGLLPVMIFAVASVQHGGMWLPNSVLVKGQRPDFNDLSRTVDTLGRGALDKLISHPPLFSLLLMSLAALLFWNPPAKDDAPATNVGQTMLFICVLTALAHLQFAAVGIDFRYEAYLIVLLLVSLAVAFARDRFGLRLSLHRKGALRVGLALITVIIASTPVIRRAQDALNLTPLATQNIFQQQIQVAHFLHRYYDTDNVALNDIGAADFFTDIHLTDVWGLDSSEVARHVLHRDWNTQALAEIARRNKVRIAIVYQPWLDFLGGVPEQWIEVGTWQIANNFICGGDTVTFYAVDPSEAPQLRAHLKEFNSEVSRYAKTRIH